MIIAFLLVVQIFASDFFNQRVRISPTRLNIGHHKASEKDVATVLYLHGFSGQIDNHRELFASLKEKGLRVVAFDFPGHGQSWGKIDKRKLRDVANMIAPVLKWARVDEKKPLILMGSSVGGTMIARILQEWKPVIPSQYNIAGAILYSPAIPAQTSDGFFEKIDPRALTRGELNHPPHPEFLREESAFGQDLEEQGEKAYDQDELTTQVPVIVYVGSRSDDDFVNVRKVLRWVRSTNEDNHPVYAFECEDALHDLDQEPRVKTFLRDLNQKFALAMIQSKAEVTQLAEVLEDQKGVCELH